MINMTHSFSMDFNEEYEINYLERVFIFDEISNITEMTGTSSTVGLIVTNSIGLVENAIGIYINSINLIKSE